MILDKVRALYEAQAKTPRGNPTGSRFGTCTAQLQLLLHPDLSQPEPYRPRALMTFEEGHRIETWLSETIKTALPGQWGLRQEPFYLDVPLDRAAADRLVRRFNDRSLWGSIRAGFLPPKIEQTGERKVRLRTAQGQKVYGLVLDPEGPTLWIPVFVDGIVQHPDVGLAVVEIKSLSNFAFRRALVGDLDYGKRCQLAGAVAATGLAAVWLCYRKETAHLLEIAYTPKADKVIVRLRRLNGQEDTFIAEPGQSEPELPGEATWDVAETWTPYDPALVETIRTRIRRAVTWLPNPALPLSDPKQHLTREAGPEFLCAKCDGEGRRTCGTCKGTGETAKLKKPCGPCGGAKTVPCTACEGKGTLEEAELPAFPCGYCPVVGVCYPFARLELDSRPHYYVRRADWLASGLAFIPPEGGLPPAAEPTETAASDAA